MTEHIENIKDLGSIVTSQLQSGSKLCQLRNLLEKYDGTDWLNYVEFNDTKYTRNIAFRNDFIDIMVICWNVRQSSGIHDHPDNGCLLKLLDGRLTEDIYMINDINNSSSKSFKLVKTKQLDKNQISYIQGKSGLHCISNNDDIVKTISLHIYSPSNYKTTYYNNS